jgi:hypothetical protein
VLRAYAGVVVTAASPTDRLMRYRVSSRCPLLGTAEAIEFQLPQASPRRLKPQFEYNYTGWLLAAYRKPKAVARYVSDMAVALCR